MGNFLKQVTPESISGVDSINSLTRYSPRFLSEESDRDQQVLIDRKGRLEEARLGLARSLEVRGPAGCPLCLPRSCAG